MRKDIPNHRIAARYDDSVFNFLKKNGPSRPITVALHCYPKHLKKGYELQWVNKVLLRLLKQDTVERSRPAEAKNTVEYYIKEK